MEDDNRKTVIRSFQSEPQAHITQLHLVAMGIEAWIEKDDGGGAYPPLQFSNGVHVVVHADDAAKAHDVLRSVEEEERAEAVKAKPAKATRAHANSWLVFVGGLLAGSLITAGVLTYLQVQEENATMEAAYDNNGDGLTDEIHFFEAGQLVRIHEDRNGDGKMDDWTFYANDEITKSHSDDNFDGREDTWIEYTGRYNYRVAMDTNFDGRPDVTSHVLHGVVKRADWHPGASERVERRIMFKNGVRAEKHTDADGDGRFDITTTSAVFEREVGRRSYVAGG